MDDLKLYINDRLVEFTQDPQVLYTYQTTDMSNPTAVKNSFSKTITIDGTPNNNDIFGHYWNLERYLLNGGEGGAYFNSSKKVPFQLYMGSDLYEEGYCKLDNIHKEGSTIKYDISLYGGLGDFFYCLSASDSGDKKKLSDLTYLPGGGTDEFDFTANIESVNTAWGVLRGTVNPNFENNKKWKVINFCPAYNGKPSDFNADKIIINSSGTTLQYGAKNADDDKWYYMKNRWTVATLPEEMTEWDVRDLRSYLQRPVIKMSSIIEACCNPDNNGGYEVELDPDFFTDDNPYWSKTFLTLPLIQNLEYSSDEQILEGATLSTASTTGEATGLMYQPLRFDLGQINSNVNNITLKCNILTHAGYSNSSFIWFWNWNGNSAHPNYVCYGSLFCQLIAVNGDTVVGASQVYNLTTPIRHNGNLYYGHNGHYPESTGYDSQTGRRKMGNGSQYVPYLDMPIYNVLGKFSPSGFKKEASYTSSGSTYASTPYEFVFNINNLNSTITGLKMVYYWGASEKKVKQEGSNWLFGSPYCDAWVTLNMAAESVSVSDNSLTITDHNITAVLGESLGRTGTKVTKALLLNTESSPCDYLLSYCKMFGLHFLKDVGEKRIHIMTRKSFYRGDEIVDLQDLIDRDKAADITPVMFKSKWYQFLQEKDESDLQQKYLTTRGVEYGCKILDTGYDFATEKIDLLKDNCIKSGIECLEKSKWFTAYNNDDSLRPWMNLGLKYTLWNGDDTFEFNAGVGNTGTIKPINEGQGMKYYDIFPKLQFHGDDNSPTDGNNCLVFYSGFKSTTAGRTNPLTYILSDDSVYQTDLNEGTPCWLFTKYETVGNKRICYKLDRIPVFERYLTGEDSGTIQKSLDFGSAQELYIPEYNLTDDTNIYHSYWRTYLTDLFDVNTRQMTCYIRVLGKPNPEWFRRFYWFDNGMWVLNKLTDWNPAKPNTTKAEFIKVQDISAYSSVSPVAFGVITVTPNTYNVVASGGTVTLSIDVESGVSWRLGVEGGSNVTLSSTAGTGSGSVTATFAANTEDYAVGAYFVVTRNDNAYSNRAYVHQTYEGEQTVIANPRDLIFDYTGGTQMVTFTWFNQGGAYIDYIDYSESSDALDFTADLSTYRDENKATITVGNNAGNDILHNYCTFYSYSADCNTSIGIDQLPEWYEFDGSGSSITLGIDYADEFSFVEVPYWISTSGKTMTAEQNPMVEEREGVVVVSVGDSSASVKVKQASGASEYSFVNPMGLVFDGSGGTQSFDITTENSWRVVGKPTWVSLSSTAGTGDATVSVTAENNLQYERDGSIVIWDMTDNITYVVAVMQYTGDVFMVARVNGSGDIPAQGGLCYLEVTSPNKSWSASTTDNFISLDKTGYTASTGLYVTFSANTGTNRVATINFVDAHGNHITYSQSQAGSNAQSGWVTPAYLDYDATGSTQTVTVNIDDTWQIVAYPTWVTFNPSSGNGVTNVAVTAIPYSGNVARTGTMVFYDTVTRTTALVIVNQNPGQGEILDVSPSSLLFESTGGTATLTIIANTDWTIG